MFCPNCGSEVNENVKFCPNCGAPLNAGNYEANNQGQPQGFDYNNYSNNQASFLNIEGLHKRNLALAIILSIVTCGIYAIYWFIVLTDETNKLANRLDSTSGGVAFLLSIVTCGIYYFYWSYKLGEKVDIIKGNPTGSTSILFLVLSIFGLGFVNYIIAQDAMNNVLPE